MTDVTIVGAGIAGLVAAINLAREGHNVSVLEREACIGGMPEFRPDPAGSPLDLAAIKRYTGVDITPAVKLMDEMHFWAWGKRYDTPLNAATKMYMVERGARESSIDTMLLKEAYAAGANVEFNRPVITQGDFAHLPPDTIVATGLKIEPYEALNIPYSPLYGYFAKGTVDHDRTTVSLFMDTFTRDYAFTCAINGASFALLFQRDIPLSREGKQKFVRLLSEGEGVEFNNWRDLLGGACPVGSIRNPRLFHGKKIIAGTLAGVIDPYLFFGMLGALVSGRIAAKAIEDKAEAYEDFRRAVRTFYPAYIRKRFLDLMPAAVKKPLARFGASLIPHAEDVSMRLFAENIPGWRLAARSTAA